MAASAENGYIEANAMFGAMMGSMIVIGAPGIFNNSARSEVLYLESIKKSKKIKLD